MWAWVWDGKVVINGCGISEFSALVASSAIGLFMFK
jgi:hypothetical protein